MTFIFQRILCGISYLTNRSRDISEAMIREADEINAMLRSIETSGFEDNQNTESETDVKIDDTKSRPEYSQDETPRQIEKLKANLHNFFD